MLATRSREREDGHDLRAHMRIAANRALSIHGLGVVLHGSQLQFVRGGLVVAAGGVVPQGQAQPVFWNESSPTVTLWAFARWARLVRASSAMRNAASPTASGTSSGSACVWRTKSSVNSIPISRASELIAKGLEGRDQPFAELRGKDAG